MARIAVRRPVLVSRPGNCHTQRPPIGDAAVTFYQGDLLSLSAGALALPIVAVGQLIWGMAMDDSKASTDKPPVAFFGENHYCADLTDAIIEISTTNAAGGVGDTVTNNGNAGPTMSSFTLGATYGINITATSYTGVQMLNHADTTNKLLTLVGWAPNQTTADYNPRALVSVPRAQLIP